MHSFLEDLVITTNNHHPSIIPSYLHSSIIPTAPLLSIFCWSSSQYDTLLHCKPLSHFINQEIVWIFPINSLLYPKWQNTSQSHLMSTAYGMPTKILNSLDDSAILIAQGCVAYCNDTDAMGGTRVDFDTSMLNL